MLRLSLRPLVSVLPLLLLTAACGSSDDADGAEPGVAGAAGSTVGGKGGAAAAAGAGGSGNGGAGASGKGGAGSGGASGAGAGGSSGKGGSSGTGGGGSSGKGGGSGTGGGGSSGTGGGGTGGGGAGGAGSGGVAGGGSGGVGGTGGVGGSGAAGVGGTAGVGGSAGTGGSAGDGGAGGSAGAAGAGGSAGDGGAGGSAGDAGAGGSAGDGGSGGSAGDAGAGGSAGDAGAGGSAGDGGAGGSAGDAGAGGDAGAAGSAGAGGSGDPCGNGVVDAGEACDGADLGGASCASLFGGGVTGSLGCSAACAFDTSACGFTGLAPSAPWPADWGDMRHARRALAKGPDVAPHQVWCTAADPGVVVGADGTTYVASGKDVRALDGAGTELWKVTIPSSVRQVFLAPGGLFVLGTGHLYVLGGGGSVLFSEATGALAGGVIGEDGALYLAFKKASAVGFPHTELSVQQRALDGAGLPAATAWTVLAFNATADTTTTGLITLRPVPMPGSGVLVSGLDLTDTTSQTRWSAHGSDGAKLWQGSRSGSVSDAPPASDGARAMFGRVSMQVVRSFADGASAWAQDSGIGGSSTAFLVGPTGRVYQSHANNLAQLNGLEERATTDGTSLWKKLGKHADVVDASGRLYGWSGSSLEAYDPDGNVLWTLPLGAAIPITVPTADVRIVQAIGVGGRLYARTDGANVCAYDP